MLAWLPRRFWAWPQELRDRGILGMNRRNGGYVLPTNPRGYYPRVDDKCLTKEICHARCIPVPETYAIIEHYGDIQRFLELIGNRREFVIKPASGSGGRGIVVIAEHNGAEFLTPGGQRWAFGDLTYHLEAVLSGLYSLAGQPDRAIVERRIVRHTVFEQIAVDGTPDIRIVLYRCVPAMAMVRLPTRASRGKANLHQGAAAAGIHLATGRTSGGVCANRAISTHPDTGHTIEGIEIPFWREALAAAMKLADGLELGYLGVDFVLDAALGPVVLEANARPGLSIQVANRRGLLPRLRFIDRQPPQRLQPGCREELIAQVAEID